MKQDHFSINVARRNGETFDGKPRYVHHCVIEKPCADFIAPGSLNDFVAELRKAFAGIGDFKITVTRWTHRGEMLEV